MYHVVWNVLLDSLLAKVKNLVHYVLKVLTRTNPDKVPAKPALLALGQLNKAPNPKLIVFLYVAMVLTVPLDWYLA